MSDVGVLEADLVERRRERRGWYFYDWANSAYATTVVAVFYGPYLTAVARQAAGCTAEQKQCTRTVLSVLGVHLGAGSFYSYVLALSIVVQVLVLPVTGAVADRSRRKRAILAAFAFTGAGATVLMWFVQGDRFLLGGLLYLVANMAFGASVVVYNSFLPELAGPDERDKVSARGWALGYLGGGLLLLLNLVLYAAYRPLGLTEGQAVRISLLSAGLWWGGFTLIPLACLRDRAREEAPDSPEHGAGVVRAGFGQLRRTLGELRRYPVTLRFLVAYLVFNDGIQSTIGLAALYGDQQLGLGQSTLISAILLVQFVAFGGALLLGRLARRHGAHRTILGSLLVWTVVVALAYLVQPGHAVQFYALAVAIGVVLGGSQALSRSLYSQLIPPGKEAEYFGLYEISERGTSWMGALLFGVTYQLTGSYRNALLSIVVFFVVGFVLLARVRVRRGIAEAGNAQPVLV